MKVLAAELSECMRVLAGIQACMCLRAFACSSDCLCACLLIPVLFMSRARATVLVMQSACKGQPLEPRRGGDERKTASFQRRKRLFFHLFKHHCRHHRVIFTLDISINRHCHRYYSNVDHESVSIPSSSLSLFLLLLLC